MDRINRITKTPYAAARSLAPAAWSTGERPPESSSSCCPSRPSCLLQFR